MTGTLVERPSPNYDARPADRAPDLLILHYTGMRNAAEALARLCDHRARVSAHYCIDEDGTAYALVDERKRAWHAGASAWEGERDINGRSVGIELVNPGHEFGYRPFREPQIVRLIALARAIVARYAIKPWHVLGHSDVAPLRKCDPGELFPWRRLAEAGIGLWPAACGGEEPQMPGAGPEPVRALLLCCGYGLDAFGDDDATVGGILRAVQRHWRPSRIDGVADRQTVAILQELVQAKYS